MRTVHGHEAGEERTTINRRDSADGTPAFHVYDEGWTHRARTDADPVYLEVDDVEFHAFSQPRCSSRVVLVLPRGLARDLGLLQQHSAGR